MAQTKPSTGRRCDCASVFDNGPSIYQHVIQTGHMEAKTCVPCRKVFGSKKALETHQGNSPKHKTTPAAYLPTTTANSNGPKSVAIKAEETNNPTPAGNPDNSKGVRHKKKGGDGTNAKAVLQCPVAVNTPSQNTTIARNKSSLAGEPSDAPISSRTRAKTRANMTQTSKKEPGADAVVVSTNAIGPAKTAIASVSSTSVSNSGPDGNNKKKNKQIPQVPSSTTASTAGQAGIVAKDLKGGKSTAGSSQANKQKQQKVTAPKKAVANQSNNNGASKQAVARAAPTSATLPYPWVSPPENPAILQALNQLCHGSKRLRSECYPGRPDRRILVGASSRYLAAPDRDPRRPGRAAVVIDCEMVEVAARRDELVRLCALDFVTGEILIDALVEPTARVIDWRTRVSGVSPAIMSAAKASGSGSGSGGVLAGWPAARARLLEYVDAGTVLAGHALHHDLKVLGVAHARVVDSAIVTAEAAFPGGGGSKLKRKWGLRNLARELLGLAIQGSPRGHDSVEDALATREVLLWCAKRPLSLAAWGAAAGAAWEREVRETAERQRRKAREKKEKEEKGKRKAARAAYAGRQVDEDYGYSCIETETVSWEEFLEMAEYPPGYDPSWSD